MRRKIFRQKFPQPPRIELSEQCATHIKIVKLGLRAWSVSTTVPKFLTVNVMAMDIFVPLRSVCGRLDTGVRLPVD